MSQEPEFNIPIIGADQDLQKRLRADLEAKRQQKAARSESKLTSLAKNERQSNRYEISNSVACYPVLPSREISSQSALVGIAVDVSMDGMKVIVDGPEPYIGMELVIGVEHQIGFQYCAGTVTMSRRMSPTTSEVGIQFRGYMKEVLQSDLVFPVLDKANMKYELPFPDTVMASVCRIGAAASTLLDTIHVCPNCRSMPTMRLGCSHCFSSNVRTSRMIHHFACAHVDFVEKFETEDQLFCQKCRTRGMIVGSDYEYLDGPNMCYDCGEANLEKILIGHCLGCEHRFNFDTATVLEIVGYRVNKLDILVLINTVQ